MSLTEAESGVIEALSLYVVNGRLDPFVSVGELAAQTGLTPAMLNGALCRLMGRNWLDCENKYVWSESDCVHLVGEGLACAAALAARRELTLYELKIGDVCFHISYEDPVNPKGSRHWIAHIRRADAPRGAPVATATSVSRAKARDAVVQALRKDDGPGDSIIPRQ